MDSGNESGNNKVSETLNVTDWSNNSKQTHPKVNWGKGSNPFVLDFEVMGGNKSRKQSIDGDAIRGIDGNLESTHLIKGHENPVIKDEQVCQTKRSRSFSSSGSELSSEDLSQGDAFEFVKPKEKIGTQPTSEQSENDISISNSFKSEECDIYSGVTTSSQASGVTHESLVQNTSLIQSPPVQVMERSGGYDPTRIPSSVFDRSKSITPVDWSLASNESLFSINVGNTSFSREHVLMFGELNKSGELIKSEELIVFSPPPSIRVAEIDRKHVEIGHKPEPYYVPDDMKHDAEKESETYIIESRVSSVTSCQSNGSGTSTNSFCFPVKKCCAWSSCYRSNCSWTFCSCIRFPRCHFRWPKCCCSKCSWPSCRCCHCNCCWAFCYSWNCSRIRCCNSSSILNEEKRSISPKKYAKTKVNANAPARQPHFQLPISEVHSKVVSKKHSRCCYCCCLPRCSLPRLPRCSCCRCCCSV